MVGLDVHSNAFGREDMVINARNRVSRCVLLVLAFAAVAWLVLYACCPGSEQKGLFFCGGEANHFYDYFVPRAVARMQSPYVQDTYSDMVDLRCVRRIVQCYPALSNYWVGLFPESLNGAVLCSSIGAVVFLFGTIAFFRRHLPESVFVATALACTSAPFVFAVTVGNLILYAAGFTLLFLAWFDSSSRWQRCVAAIALALATALKVTPALLGVLYLGRNARDRIGYVALAAVAALFFLMVPFLFCGGFFAWLENASMMNNSSEFTSMNCVGLYGLVTMLVRSFTMSFLPSGWERLLHLLSSCIGVTLLVAGCLSRGDSWERGAAVTLGMMFVPPTMMIYTSLYLIPLAITGMYRSDSRLRLASAVYCIFSCMLLRIPLFLGPPSSLNICFAAAASVDLAFWLSCLTIGRLLRGKQCV